MEKITKEEMDKLTLQVGSSTLVRTVVLQMKPGEILKVEPEDWNQKNGPGAMCSRIQKTTGMEFSVKTIANRQGWVIERVK